jgi:Xaa-Pro aminopeptidase
VPMARTFVPGRAPGHVQRLADAADHGLASVLETVSAGVPVHGLAQAWNVTLSSYGYEKPSRIGYSIGIGYPPDWGERTISLRSEDQTVLHENMTFHVICGMWMDGYGYEVSESIRVTATGVELFTSFGRGLLSSGDSGPGAFRAGPKPVVVDRGTAPPRVVTVGDPSGLAAAHTSDTDLEPLDDKDFA